MGLVSLVCPVASAKGFGVQEYVLAVAYVIVLLLTIKQNNFLSLPSLFLFALGFFGVFGVILSILGLSDYRVYSSSFIDYTWSNEAKYVVLNAYLVLIVIAHIVLNLVVAKNKSTIMYQPISTYLVKIGRILFLATFPFAILNAAIQVYLVSINGYSSLYVGAGNSVLTQLLSPLVLLNTAGFYAICAGIPKESEFNKIAGLFLIESLTSSLVGARGSLIIPLLFILYFRYRIYGKKLTIYQVLGLVVFLSFMLVVYSFIRGQADESILQMIIGQLASTSGSISIAAVFFDVADSLRTFGLPYLFGDITRLFDVLSNWSIYSSGQSISMIEIRNDLSHQLSYYCNPSGYLSGNGMGGNMVAEMLQFGPFGFVLLAVLFCLLIRVIENKWPTSSFSGFLIYLFFSGMFFAPRASYLLIDTYNLAKWILIFVGIYFIAYWVSKRSTGTLDKKSK